MSSTVAQGFALCPKLGVGGIVSKHRKQAYRSGPSKSWVKAKNPNAPGVLRFKDERAQDIAARP
jgi:ATP-dependent DNA ligase